VRCRGTYAATTIDLMLRPRDDCGATAEVDYRALRELFFVSLFLPKGRIEMFFRFFILAQPFYTHSHALYKSKKKTEQTCRYTVFERLSSAAAQKLGVVLGCIQYT